MPCLSSTYYDVGLGTFVHPTAVYTGTAGSCDYETPRIRTRRRAAGSATPSTARPASAKTGASWASLWSGNATGSLNNVGPRFTNASISDQWRPNDKLLINAAVRYDNFTYNLPDSATAATQFYA